MNPKRQLILGMFFVTTLSVLAIYTLFFTDVNLFKDPIEMEVRFSGAHGLREGDPVMISGLRIGRVGKLEYLSDAEAEQQIRAVLFLNEELELLADARISIQESTLLGGRQVDIYAGTPGGPPLGEPEDGFYLGRIQRNPIDALGAVGDLLTENSEALASIFANIDAITLAAAEGQGTVGRILNDEEIAQDLAESIANINKITTDVQAGSGVLGTLIYDEVLVADVKGAVAGLQTIVDDLQSKRGLAGRLIYDDALANEVSRAIESFANVGARIDRGEGVMGKLLSNEELGEELDAIIRNFREASTSVQQVAARLESGDGTLGKLLSDEQLYDEALAAVGLLTRSLEDYREAAPISTFTGVLFSAF